MGDPEFLEFKVVFDNMPQYIKAPSDCYRLAVDLDSPMEDDKEENLKNLSSMSDSGVDGGGSQEETLSNHSTDISRPLEDSECSKLKPPWVPKPALENGENSAAKPIKKRRRLPEIPPDKKPLGRLVNEATATSLADEFRELDKDRRGESSIKSRLVRQVSQNMFLEIDTSGVSPRPCLRYYSGVNPDDSSPEDSKSKINGDIDSGTSTAHSPDGLKSLSPVANSSLSRSSSSTLSSTPSGSRLQLQDATHRGLHKFLSRHNDELEIEIGDPIYVQKEGDDLWCEGVNLRSGQSGIFPSAYAMDIDYSELDPDAIKGKKERYLLDFLGSIEVTCHKGNDVLCQAVRKVARACAKDVGVHGPHPCILEINDQGLRMVDHKRPLPNHVPMHDYFFNLKNVTFCGYHPYDHRYFGFITKHPLHQRFACHIFMGQESTRDVAEAVGRAFHRFYFKFIETAYPVEDIYIE